MAAKVIICLRILLIGFYLFAGAYHFIRPDFYIGLIPPYLPYPYLINYVSGFLEIVLAICTIFPKTRQLAVQGIILLLLLFIPAHIHFIQIGSCLEGYLCFPEWVSWLRLLVVHPLLILWAWKVR